jgi:hypothetical protein
MTTTTEDPAGRWHTVPFDPDIDDPQGPVDDAEEDDGAGLDGVLVYGDPEDPNDRPVGLDPGGDGWDPGDDEGDDDGA